MVKGIAGLLPVSTWKFQPVPKPGNHDAGSGRPVTKEDMRCMNYNQPTPILLRRRSARQKHVHPRARSQGQDRLRAGPARRPRRVPRTPIKPYRKNLVVGCECMFAWYWLADLCEDETHPLRARPRPGHEAHPRRQGQERQDRRRQARRHASRRPVPDGLRLPAGQARRPATCLRRRSLLRPAARQLIAHIVNTNSQYNLPPFDQEAHLRRQPHATRSPSASPTRARG